MSMAVRVVPSSNCLARHMRLVSWFCIHTRTWNIMCDYARIESSVLDFCCDALATVSKNKLSIISHIKKNTRSNKEREYIMARLPLQAIPICRIVYCRTQIRWKCFFFYVKKWCTNNWMSERQQCVRLCANQQHNTTILTIQHCFKWFVASPSASLRLDLLFIFLSSSTQCSLCLWSF